jgi:hypothetical protein
MDEPRGLHKNSKQIEVESSESEEKEGSASINQWILEYACAKGISTIIPGNCNLLKRYMSPLDLLDSLNEQQKETNRGRILTSYLCNVMRDQNTAEFENAVPLFYELMNLTNRVHSFKF